MQEPDYDRRPGIRTGSVRKGVEERFYDEREPGIRTGSVRKGAEERLDDDQEPVKSSGISTRISNVRHGAADRLYDMQQAASDWENYWTGGGACCSGLQFETVVPALALVAVSYFLFYLLNTTISGQGRRRRRRSVSSYEQGCYALKCT